MDKDKPESDADAEVKPTTYSKKWAALDVILLFVLLEQRPLPLTIFDLCFHRSKAANQLNPEDSQAAVAEKTEASQDPDPRTLLSINSVGLKWHSTLTLPTFSAAAGCLYEMCADNENMHAISRRLAAARLVPLIALCLEGDGDGESGDVINSLFPSISFLSFSSSVPLGKAPFLLIVLHALCTQPRRKRARRRASLCPLSRQRPCRASRAASSF